MCIALFCLVFQGKFYAYHWYPLYPPAIILAVIGFATVSFAATQLSTRVFTLSLRLINAALNHASERNTVDRTIHLGSYDRRPILFKIPVSRI